MRKNIQNGQAKRSDNDNLVVKELSEKDNAPTVEVTTVDPACGCERI